MKLSKRQIRQKRSRNESSDWDVIQEFENRRELKINKAIDKENDKEIPDYDVIETLMNLREDNTDISIPQVLVLCHGRIETHTPRYSLDNNILLDRDIRTKPDIVSNLAKDFYNDIKRHLVSTGKIQEADSTNEYFSKIDVRYCPKSVFNNVFWIALDTLLKPNGVITIYGGEETLSKLIPELHVLGYSSKLDNKIFDWGPPYPIVFLEARKRM